MIVLSACVCIYCEEGRREKAEGRESCADVFRSLVDCRALVWMHRSLCGYRSLLRISVAVLWSGGRGKEWSRCEVEGVEECEVERVSEGTLMSHI